MSTPRVEIDLNDTDENGLTVALLSDVQGQLVVGRMVTAYESEDQVCAPALVREIDEEFGIAYLMVNWQAMHKETPADASFRLDRAGWTATRSAERGIARQATRSSSSTSHAISVKA